MAIHCEMRLLGAKMGKVPYDALLETAHEWNFVVNNEGDAGFEPGHPDIARPRADILWDEHTRRVSVKVEGELHPGGQKAF